MSSAQHPQSLPQSQPQSQSPLPLPLLPHPMSTSISISTFASRSHPKCRSGNGGDFALLFFLLLLFYWFCQIMCGFLHSLRRCLRLLCHLLCQPKMPARNNHNEHNMQQLATCTWSKEQKIQKKNSNASLPTALGLPPAPAPATAACLLPKLPTPCP